MRAGPHHRPERGAGRTVPAAVEDTHLAGARTLKGPGERGCGEGSCVGSTGLQTEVVPSHPVCDTLSSNPACLLLESFLSRLRVRPACQSLSPWDYLNGVLGSASLHSLPSPAVSRRRPGLCLLWFSQARRMAGLASEFRHFKLCHRSGCRSRVLSLSLLFHPYFFRLSSQSASFCSFPRAPRLLSRTLSSVYGCGLQASRRVRSLIEIIFEPLFLH